MDARSVNTHLLTKGSVKNGGSSLPGAGKLKPEFTFLTVLNFESNGATQINGVECGVQSDVDPGCDCGRKISRLVVLGEWILEMEVMWVERERRCVERKG